MTAVVWVLALTVVACWAGQLLLVRRAWSHVPSLGPALPPADAPMVSVLVPARDEERDVGATLRALLAQDWPRIEIVCIDDHSSDRTGAIARGIAAGDERLRVIVPPVLPEGWVGKCWALHTGVAATRGPVLLFLDADILLAPDAVRAAMGAMGRDGLDALGLWPEVECRGFWERVLQPFMIGFLVAMGQLAGKLLGPRAPAMTPGAFLLARREAYGRAGGHTAVRDRIVEDVALGSAIRSHGGKVAARRGESRVRVRQYHGFREIWRGWSKNLFPGLNYRIVPLVALLLAFVGGAFLPPVLWIVSLLAGWPVLPWATACVATIAARFFQDRILGQPGWGALFHPLAGAVFAGILWNSSCSRLAGRGNVWRGRVYRFGPARGWLGLD